MAMNDTYVWVGIGMALVVALAWVYKKRSAKAEETPSLATLKKIDMTTSTSLKLSYTYLYKVPDNLLKLTQLRTLELHSAKLEDLPTTFTVLGSLTHLNVSGNKFKSFPKPLSGLPNLEELLLTSCQLATIPEDMFPNLSRLSVLKLDSNSLQRLPNSISSLGLLKELDISKNNIHSLPDIGHITSLQSLVWSANKLPSLPKELFSLTSLHFLRLNNNSLISIPSQISKMISLTSLEVRENKLTSLPPEISFLTNLRQIYLSDNQVSQLPSLSSLTSLTTIDCNSNQIVSLSFLHGIPSLQRLHLRYNIVTHFSEEFFHSCSSSLQVVDLTNNALTHIPNSISVLKNIKCLNFSFNKISHLPKEIALLNFRELSLTRNPFLEYPEELKDLRSKRPEVLFSSSLPDEILPKLFLGNLEAAQFVESLLHRKITHILRVLESGTPEHADKFTYKIIPIQDSLKQDITKYFTEAIQFIDMARQEERSVLVHCAAGISRSATIVIAYIMYHKRWRLEESFKFLKQRRPEIQPNSNFTRQLKQFEATLFSDSTSTVTLEDDKAS